MALSRLPFLVAYILDFQRVPLQQTSKQPRAPLQASCNLSDILRRLLGEVRESV